GFPLDEQQRELFRQCTGREHGNSEGYQEAWMVIGRRGGKSFALALIAVFLACFKDWQQYLGPGERGTIMIVAADRKQARVIMRYCKGLLASVPMLAQLIQRDRDGVSDISLDLSNRVTLEVHTASYRTTRGYTIVAALLDELAFWPTDDSSEPDREVINAIRPGMINVPGSMLLCASSPYARRGALFDAYQKHYGQDCDVLVWQAATRTMNPSVPQAIIDKAYEDDPASASAEYGALFRADVESYISRDAIAACVSMDVPERPAATEHRISRVRRPVRRTLGQHDAGHRSSRRQHIGDRCHQGGQAAVLARIRGRRIRTTAPALSHQPHPRRPLWRRMA